MPSISPQRRPLPGCFWRSRAAFVVLAACANWAPTLAADLPLPPAPALAAPEPACPPACRPPLPPTPERAPRPPTGPTAVGSFVDSLSTNDAAIEVLVGQGRILTLKESLARRGKLEPLVAVGDPTVVGLVVVNPRQIRLIGWRLGVTDLSITTADGQVYNFEVRVVLDLDVLRGQLRCAFPDASLKLAQLRGDVVVEGQARDTAQVARIRETIQAYLTSVEIAQAIRIRSEARVPEPAKEGKPGEGPRVPGPAKEGKPGEEPRAPALPGAVPEGVAPEVIPALQTQALVARSRIINLIRVPGSQQVLLKVRVAELNRTGLRQIGADFLSVNPNSGTIAGTQIGGAAISAVGTIQGRTIRGGTIGSTTTAFGIFEPSDFQIFLTALRRNSLVKILAEPNLIALNGHQASFLAGGQFPVPVPQVGASGVAPTITVNFQEFGVRLGFVPYILDGDVIRLTVDPEVSTIDFSIGTTLVAGGSPVPGLNTRKAHTVVEMRQGQTLAIAGLLQLQLDANTSRIPGLGDLPFIGPFFSNTSNTRTEKELLVLVTPYLVEPMNAGQVPPTPGDEVKEPNDLEFYLLNRIEARTGRDFRSTTEYDDAVHVLRYFLRLHGEYVRGPYGFCD